MNYLTLDKIENYSGGNFIDGACAGIGTGSAVYTAGLATNFWNPVGWVSAGFIAADLACGGYELSK